MSEESRKNPDTEGHEGPEKGPRMQGQGSSTGPSDTGNPEPPKRPLSPLIQRESLRERIQKGPAAVIVASLCIFVILLSAHLIIEGLGMRGEPGGGGQQETGLDPSNALTLNVFFPLEGKVALEQRLVPKVTGARDIAAAAVRQFLSGPSEGMVSFIPDAVELSVVFLSQDRVLYLDFSSALTLNFQGDAVAEFLFLRALYRTLNENTYGIKGYRLLVDGREVDTIGGHIYILEGLEKAVPYRLMDEDEIEK